MTSASKKQRVWVGTVVSNKMDKTVVVAVNRFQAHPLYGKVMRGETRLKAHDEANACQQGDWVKLIETRPLSKEKRWRVVQILEHGRPGK